ncbi:MAG: tetratricopeptide repeat protein [Bacteroidetes bacterium]|nr:tetratricopeptide repeat protein [Bacteroidota bacterium]
MAKKTVKLNTVTAGKETGKTFAYVFLAVLSVSFAVICFNNKFLQDDAYISFRFIDNFVNGNGLVFNIGERVEGYTNLLWVLILSALKFFKINIESFSQDLSVLFGIIIIFITYRLSDIYRISDDTAAGKKGKTSETSGSSEYLNLIPPVMLVFTASFIFWSVSGMETTMFITFSLAGVYYYIKGKDSEEMNYRFPLFILLATLTRPEGMYFFGLIIIHKVFFAFREKGSGAFKSLFAKKELLSYLIYIVPLIFYFAIRYSYYGYLFPNTFYAKTGFSEAYLNAGIDYFTKFLTSYLLYGVILLAPLYLFKKKENHFILSLYYLLIFSFIVYSISIGGDVLKQNRFFLPVLPLIYILFAKLLTEIYFTVSRKNSKSIALGAVTIIALAVCIYYYSSQKEKLDSDIQSENGLVDKMKSTGNWFKVKQQSLGRPMTLAATTIGAVSYFAGPNVNVIDLLGLTDKEIAHNPKIIPEISAGEIGWKERNYNADYVMSRDPDYIYFSTGVKPSAYGERALYTNGEFIKYYYPYYFTDKSNNSTDVVYKRKSEDEVLNYNYDFPGNPNYKNTYVNMFNQAMNSSRDKSRTQAALDEFRQSIDTGPAGFGLPYQYMGDIYMQMGNKDQAKKSYEKAVEVDDFNVIAHYQLYQLYSQAGDSLKAAESIQKIQKYDPEVLR